MPPMMTIFELPPLLIKLKLAQARADLRRALTERSSAPLAHMPLLERLMDEVEAQIGHSPLDRS